MVKDARAHQRFQIDGVEFVLANMFPAAGEGAFSLIKPASSIAAYAELPARHDRPAVVELGIAYGGAPRSCAWRHGRERW